MSKPSGADQCRLSVVTPDHVVELAVPASVPIVDFLPAVLRFGGRDLAESGLAHDGWVLQRFGGPALPEARTLDEIGVVDGETLCLRPRRAQAPQAVFDDLVDGLATAVREREDRARAAFGRWAGPASGAVLLAAGIGALASAGSAMRTGTGALASTGSATRTLAAGIAAVLLLAAAAVAARVSRSAPAAAVLGLGAAGYAATAGAFAAGWTYGHTAAAHPGTAMLWAGMAALIAAPAAYLAGGTMLEAFVGAGTVALGAVACGALAAATGVGVARAASVVGVVAVGSVLAVPWAAFRLAGQRLPALPATASDIQRDEAPSSQGRLWDLSAALDGLMASLLAGVAVLAVGSAVLTAGARGAAAQIAAVDIGVALLLRARVFVRTPLKLLIHSAGILAVAGAAWRIAAVSHTGPATAIAIGAVVLGLAATAAVAKADQDRPPYAARAADVLEYLAVGALVPLALAVAGVFGWARGIG